MTLQHDTWRLGRIAGNLEEIDRELGRLARLCRVPLLRPGVIQRVLHNEADVCGTSNPFAFEKLRVLLFLYFAVRAKAAGQVGQPLTAAIESYVVGRLSASFPEFAADWPPA